MADRGWRSALGGLIDRSEAQRDLEVARRLGRWYTDEDRQLLRQHQAQMVQARRQQAVRKVGEIGTVGMLAAAWAIPPLWPVAIVASFRVFPRTSRLVLLSLLGLTGATLLGSGVLVHQVLESAQTAVPASLPRAEP